MSEMTRSPIDRRAARTRASLQQAHLRLILEKGYDAVTIKDICGRAQVGRSTFYSHYRNKDDLKRSGFERLRRQLIDWHAGIGASDGHDGPRFLRFSRPMFEHARDNIHLYRALAGNRGSAVALDAIRQMLSDLVRKDLAADDGGHASREATVQYVVGAYMALLTWWLDGGARISPRRMDEDFRRLVTKGIAVRL
jgi:AcrR family transcriptional regulator